MDIKKLIKLYAEAGYCAWLYPRLKAVSIGGGKRMPIDQAKKRMIETLKRIGKL